MFFDFNSIAVLIQGFLEFFRLPGLFAGILAFLVVALWVFGYIICFHLQFALDIWHFFMGVFYE